MKKLVCVGVLATFVAGAVCMGWLAFGRHRDGWPCCHGRAAGVFVPPEEGEIPGHPTPKALPLASLVKPSVEQRRELSSLFRGIDEAYTNCQPDVLRNRLSQVPDYFYHLYDADYLEFNGRMYMDTFVPNYLDKDKPPLSSLLGADDVRGFENYVRVCFEAARFVGGFIVRRAFHGVMNDDLRRLESKLLCRLLILKRHFGETGRKAFEEATDSLIGEWHGQIESPKGLTRQRACYFVGLNLYMRRRKPEDCWLSNEEILEVGRAQADSLVRLGYTPKWLDAEFPLPAEGKPYAGNPHVRFDEGATSSANAEVEGSTPLDP